MGSHRPELALNMIVGSSSCSPDSVSPDVAKATTPALVVASFSAVLRAVSDGLHRIGVSAMSRTSLPNRGVQDILTHSARGSDSRGRNFEFAADTKKIKH